MSADAPRILRTMHTPIPPNRVAVTLQTLADWTGGTAVGADGPVDIVGICTDSRSLEPGMAFVALVGESFDGHRFVEAAFRAGAKAAIVAKGMAGEGTEGATSDGPTSENTARWGPLLRVDDTLVAWGAIAHAHLECWRRLDGSRRVLAITGSAGKTTTKELLAALLVAHGPTLKTPGNLNNRIGLPAVVLCAEAHHRFAVLEAGMSLRGEIAAMGAIVRPDVALITNIGVAHAAGVGGSRKDVAREKGALFETLRPGGTAVVNADDDEVELQVARLPKGARGEPATIVRFGRSERADVRLVHREPNGLGSRVHVALSRPGGAVEQVSIALPMGGEAAAIDLCAAIAAAEAALGHPLSEPDLQRALDATEAVEGRGRVHRLAGDVLLIDDAYNANPSSMHASVSHALELGMHRGGRVVFCLGEMKELGILSEDAHRDVGRVIAKAGGARVVLACGAAAYPIAEEAARGGAEVVRAETTDDALRLLSNCIGEGDTVLVKASRSVGLERVVKGLLGEEGARG